MSYSTKQKLYADFMLKKIGITNIADIEAYLAHLEKLYGRMVSYPSQRYIGGIAWHYSVSDCIDLLKQEIDLKKSKQNIKSIEPKPLIAATDLANYEYCAASFVISNSFVIENPSGAEFTEMGKQLHEQLIAARTKWKAFQPTDTWSSDSDIDAIRQSRLIYSGHKDYNKNFTNGNWVGAPDYIFQNTENKFFVVEEKFHKKRDPKKTSSSEIIDIMNGGSGFDEDADIERIDWVNYKGYFFSNHIVQIASYIKNIKEYFIAYGYLLYWYYDFDNDNEPYIHKVVAKKIILDEAIEKLYSNATKGVEELKTNKHTAFAVDKLNMRKCAGCVVNKYCGHKTRKFQTLPFPYSRNFLTLDFVTFPEKLKKPIQ